MLNFREVLGSETHSASPNNRRINCREENSKFVKVVSLCHNKKRPFTIATWRSPRLRMSYIIRSTALHIGLCTLWDTLFQFRVNSSGEPHTSDNDHYSRTELPRCDMNGDATVWTKKRSRIDNLRDDLLIVQQHDKRDWMQFLEYACCHVSYARNVMRIVHISRQSRI